MSFGVDICPVFMGVYLPAEFQDQMATLRLTFWETVKLLTKWFDHFTIPPCVHFKENKNKSLFNKITLDDLILAHCNYVSYKSWASLKSKYLR